MAFAAMSNHGMYPMPGVYVRAGLVISDSNDGKGLLWNTTPSTTTQPYPSEILHMQQRFGSPKIRLPHNQWFWNRDSQKSSTALMRMVHSQGFDDPAENLALNRNDVQALMAHTQRIETVKWTALVVTPFVISLAAFAGIAWSPWAWFLAAPVLIFWIFVLLLVMTTGAFWLGFH